MRGVTHGLEQRDLLLRISTRTPHAGSDPLALQPGRRGAISTRTPHAGSDMGEKSRAVRLSDFNPHSPCGE